MRAEEAKIVQEKAAKIKEWVTLKLAEVSPALFREGSVGWACVWGCPAPGLALPPALGGALTGLHFLNHLSFTQLKH